MTTKRRPQSSASMTAGGGIGFEDPYEDGGTCWTNLVLPRPLRLVHARAR